MAVDRPLRLKGLVWICACSFGFVALEQTKNGWRTRGFEIARA